MEVGSPHKVRRHICAILPLLEGEGWGEGRQ